MQADDKPAFDVSSLSVEDQLKIVHDRLERGSARMHGLQDQLVQNTEVLHAMRDLIVQANLAELRDLFVAARVGFKVLGWAGTAAKWLAQLGAASGVLYAIWYFVTHGGSLPPTK